MSSGPKWSLRHGSQYQRLPPRPGCGAPATATLRFQSTQRQAWLVELDENAARTQGDLCPRHAAALVLPRGRVLHDERASGGWAPVANGAPADTANGAGAPDESVAEPPPEPEAQPAATTETASRGVPAQFGPNDEDDPDVEEALGEILDARTPLLQRAFRNAKPKTD